MVTVAMTFKDHAASIFERFEDEPYVIGRGLTMHVMYYGHIHTDMRNNYENLEKGMRSALSTGDKVLRLMCVGAMAAWKIWAAEQNVSEIEAYIETATEEFPGWQETLRGGPFLVGALQYVRALAGKTNHKVPQDVLSDEVHSTSEYITFITKNSTNPDRPASIYNSYRISALFRFGHFKEAMEFGEEILEQVDGLLCMRYVYSTYFFLAMATLACLRDAPDRSDREELLTKVMHYRTKIEVVASVNPTNFYCWTKLLEAELCNIHGQHGDVHANYEAAVNHAVVQFW